MKHTTRTIGISAEQFACKYLQQQGMDLIETNYHCKLGEIDLIMLHERVLVFVEVRYRKNSDFLHAIETIDKRKQRKILLTSQNYLQRKPAYQSCDLRFDVVLVSGTGQEHQIEWIENAFTADS